MFSGIIEKKCTIEKIQKSDNSLIIETKALFDDVKDGDSLAINGVCLTTKINNNGNYIFDVSPETLAKTTFADLKANDIVNVERALMVSSRLSGHIVTGHVDRWAFVIDIINHKNFTEIVIGHFTKAETAYILPKGSITLDGVSLTINEVHKERISLMLIPHTQKLTTLGSLSINQKVNIEFDYLAKVINHQAQIYQ